MLSELLDYGDICDIKKLTKMIKYVGQDKLSNILPQDEEGLDLIKCSRFIIEQSYANGCVYIYIDTQSCSLKYADFTQLLQFSLDYYFIAIQREIIQIKDIVLKFITINDITNIIVDYANFPNKFQKCNNFVKIMKHLRLFFNMDWVYLHYITMHKLVEKLKTNRIMYLEFMGQIA